MDFSDFPCLTPSEEARQILQDHQGDYPAGLKVITEQFTKLQNRSQILLTVGTIALTVTGFSGSKIAATGMIPRLLCPKWNYCAARTDPQPEMGHSNPALNPGTDSGGYSDASEQENSDLWYCPAPRGYRPCPSCLQRRFLPALGNGKRLEICGCLLPQKF